MTISRNVASALERASWIRRMFEAANQLREERGADAVADLSLGNPCNEPPAAFFDHLADEARERTGLRHRYMTNAGYPEARAAIAAHMEARTGLPYEAADICLTVGAAGAINVLLRTLLDEGDEIVLSSPCFVEYPFYVENYRGQTCVVPGTRDFLPNPERLADGCSATTRAIILNSPNNPTGRIYPERTYLDLGRALAAKSAQLSRPIYLIFDDPYRHLYYTEQPPPEPARFYDQVLYVSSFSKDLGLAGERIGYIAIHPGAHGKDELRRALPFAMRALGQVNAPAIMQRAAARLIDLPRDDVRAFYRTRRDQVAAALDKAGLAYPPLEGAFYAFPESPEPDDLVFCRRMLDKGLILVPGTAFGIPGHFRLSYSVPEDVLARGLRILAESV
ncbi:MAG: pyridoxal phosphate-dependent aminotransferase [Planctomycetota bacterium]|nr:pyridoxal phosphate-dependent aminotransferase [Planctomycetota bacterium]